MRQIRQALPLHLEADLRYARVARAVGVGVGIGIGIGKGTVGSSCCSRGLPAWTGALARRSPTRRSRLAFTCRRFALPGSQRKRTSRQPNTGDRKLAPCGLHAPYRSVGARCQVGALSRRLR